MMSSAEMIKFIEQLRETNELFAATVLSKLNYSDSAEIVCVACSGGSDSVYLLVYLLENFCNFKKRVIVLHFNHNLRGEASDGDEKFVEELSKEVGVKFYSEKLVILPKIVSEDALRNARNEFFVRAMNKFESKFLILGQQKNDVAETLLMRLTRASDTAGLSAPKEVSIWGDGTVRVRPLLDITKIEIERRLVARGIKWRDDESNFENDFLRNKIRNVIIPQMQKFIPGFDIIENLASAKKNIENADEAVTFFANKYLAGRNIAGRMDVTDFIGLPTAVLKKIVVKFFEINSIDVRKSYINFALDNVLAGRTFAFGIGIGRRLTFDGECLALDIKIQQNTWSVDSISIGDNALPNFKTLRVEEVEVTDQLMQNLKNIDVGTQCLMAHDKISYFNVKSYSPNYEYIRFGHKRPKQLRDILTSRIIKNDNKFELPVIFIKDKICWVPHLPVAEIFKIKEYNKKALLLTYF